jgi:hypothetical protein
VQGAVEEEHAASGGVGRLAAEDCVGGEGALPDQGAAAGRQRAGVGRGLDLGEATEGQAAGVDGAVAVDRDRQRAELGRDLAGARDPAADRDRDRGEAAAGQRARGELAVEADDGRRGAGQGVGAEAGGERGSEQAAGDGGAASGVGWSGDAGYLLGRWFFFLG